MEQNIEEENDHTAEVAQNIVEDNEHKNLDNTVEADEAHDKNIEGENEHTNLE